MNKNLSLLLLLFCISTQVFADSPTTNRQIGGYYQSIDKRLPMDERIRAFSALFLNKPYHLGPLGEGHRGNYDQSPLYRTDKFDCQTYVSTVLALAHAKNLTHFKQTIRQVRYIDGKPSYLTRNHFVSTDWNIHNHKKGYITDITRSIKNKQGKPIFKIATAVIDKPNWLKKLSIDSIKLKNTKNREAALRELQSKSSEQLAIEAKTPYLPLNKLFSKDGKARAYLFTQLPDVSIVEIVRPNWDLTKAAGTHLNISHLGFAIRKDGVLYYREASSVENKIIDIPLTTYLKNYLDSPTVKGINVQQING